MKSVPELVGPQYAQLATEVTRIKRYRNKLMHGQATGQSIQSVQLERDVKHLIAWIEALAVGTDAEFGYNGLRRNTFREAKAGPSIAVAKFPFTTNADFATWLRGI